VVDQLLADQDLAGLGVDERGDAARRRVVVDQRGLPRRPHPVLGRRDGDEPRMRRLAEPGGVEHGPVAAGAPVRQRADLKLRVPAGRPHRVGGPEVARAGHARVRRQRGRDVRDLAVGDADRDQAVAARRQAAEALAQQHRATLADRRRADQLEVARGRRADAEQGAVAGDPLARCGDLAGGQAARDHPVDGGQRLRRAEAVPGRLQAGARHERALACRWRITTLAVVDVRGSRMLPLDGRSGDRASRRQPQQTQHRHAHRKT